MKFDTKNLKFLAELEKDGRASISQIAKKIGVSKEVANYRFKQLNVIKKFDTLVDYFALGYQCYKLIVNLHNMKYHMRPSIIAELKKSDLISVNTYLFSDWDLEIDMWVKTPKEFYDFYSQFIEKYSDYIAEKNFLLITKIHFLSSQYLHKSKNVITLGNTKQTTVDEIDEKIIAALEEDPRSDLLKLAEILKTPAHVVRYRISRLIKKEIIKGVVPVIDPSLVGFSKYEIQLTLNQPSLRKVVVEHLLNHEYVTKITELIGSKDLSFEACFKVNTELDRALEELRLHTSAIKDFEVMNLVID